MSLKAPQKSNHQLVRLLQISLAIEEVAEARARKHANQSGDRGLRAFLKGAAEESARHQQELARLVERVGADAVSCDEIQRTVADQYEPDRDFENPLYDQLCNAETAFTLYDDLVHLLEDPNAEF